MSSYVQRISIKKWAEDDRPREKLVAKGKGALSDAELLAILIGSGNKFESAVDLSKRILTEAGNKLGSLGRLNVQDLVKYNGIGEAKAISIIAAMELSRRRVMEPATAKVKVQGSRDAFELFHPQMSEMQVEEFWMICLNRANTVLDRVLISRGGVSGTVADPKIIFKHAIQCLASAIILVHNHPSDNVQPSEADVKLTRRLVESGRLLEVAVLDHIIVGETSYYSFADEGQVLGN
jgi:DNA repair protein RadC